MAIKKFRLELIRSLMRVCATTAGEGLQAIRGFVVEMPDAYSSSPTHRYKHRPRLTHEIAEVAEAKIRAFSVVDIR